MVSIPKRLVLQLAGFKDSNWFCVKTAVNARLIKVNYHCEGCPERKHFVQEQISS